MDERRTPEGPDEVARDALPERAAPGPARGCDRGRPQVSSAGPRSELADAYRTDVRELIEDLARLEQATPWLRTGEVVDLPRRRRRPGAGIDTGAEGVADVVDLDAFREARARRG